MSSQIFEKDPQIQNLIMMLPAAAELFHADTQMDMTKPNAAFRNSANAAYK